MATSKANMQKLLEERQRLLTELEALKERIKGLDIAISILNGESAEDRTEAPRVRRRRGNQKGIVLDILRNAGSSGLGAQDVVDRGKDQGIDLDRASVSSLLSRLKRDGVCAYNRATGRYALAEFSDEIGNVHPFLTRDASSN